MKSCPIDPLVLSDFNLIDARKVTSGRTGLWQPSVQSDGFFLFFDVGSSYHCVAEVTKCRVVHPLTGNMSWVLDRRETG